jgi:hypothetical protein
MDICARKPHIRLLKACFIRKVRLKDRFSEADSGAGNPLRLTCLIQANPQKAIFYIIDRACPTNGSDCGSLHSHNLTLFVSDCHCEAKNPPITPKIGFNFF